MLCYIPFVESQKDSLNYVSELFFLTKYICFKVNDKVVTVVFKKLQKIGSTLKTSDGNRNSLTPPAK